ncbi:MAG: pitrilysin family protein [Salinibacter sp.]
MSTDSNLAPRIQDHSAGPARVLTLPTSVDDVVSWRASFLTYPDLAAGDALRQKLTVSLLDKGTQQRDRFELARVLEDCGAKLNLSSDGLYVDISGRALSDDVSRVMDVLAEMLRAPAFDPDEFEKARAQAAASLQRRMEKTSAQASAALSRHLFNPAHPNHAPPPEEQLQALQELTVDDVEAYHDEHFGPQEWTMAFVGDLEHEAIRTVVADAFEGWTASEATPVHETEPASQKPGHTILPMPDKSNVDVRMGHALPLRRDHSEYPALYVGNYILGGNFAARLMGTVRDEKGLTYHIGSSLSGISTRYAGYWQVRVTLSHESLSDGIEATREVVETFVKEGPTEDELQAKKTTITGSYTVGLATTRRLAQSILTTAERGFDMHYLDQFPRDIEALSLDEVTTAVQTYLRPEALHEARAGVRPDPVAAP